VNSISIALLLVALAIVVAGQWGVVDALLPGGRWRPHTAATVEREGKRGRTVAYAIMAIIVLALLGAAVAIEWRLHAS
jgi:hypothetical protein